MNDFTKEELMQLMEACMYWFECPDDGIIKENQPLVGKIQSMIDSYCEHEYIGYIEGTTAMPYCNKCRKAIP